MSEIGFHKILLFPEKLKRVMDVSAEKVDPTYPIVVELSLTNKCNQNCMWCSDAKLRRDHPGSLDFDVVKKLFVDLKNGGVRGITIEGGGEPTVYDEFNEVVKMGHELGLKLGLITNGVKGVDKELAGMFEWIRVSLDATTREEYKTCKGLDAFDKVIENIALMTDLADTVGVGFVVSTQNSSKPRELVKLVKEAGADYIHFRPVVDAPAVAYHGDLGGVCEMSSPGFDVMCDAMIENRVRGNGGVPCRAHSLHSVIAADGGVYICGRLNVYNWWKPIGDINQSSFAEIWASDMRASQNCSLMSGEFCSRYCLECRISKFNVEIDKAIGAKTKNFL